MSGRSPISGVYECNACDSRWLRSQQIDALTAERDEALALADRIRRGMDLALEQQRERVAAAEAIVSRMEEVVSAATEVAALLAAGWEHDDDRDCVTCDAERRLAAALARLDADPPREPEA